MNKQDFPKPSITGDTIVFFEPEREILLIRRKKDPYQGCWAIVGGFFNPINQPEQDVHRDHSIKDSAIRELAEETNIQLDKLNPKEYIYKFLTVQDTPDRDPRGRVVTLVYVLSYWGEREKLNVKAMDDAEEFRWFKLSDILNNAVPLAFDHLESIQKFARRQIYE